MQYSIFKIQKQNLLCQLNTIVYLKQKFGKSVDKLQMSKMPGTPGYGVSRDL